MKGKNVVQWIFAVFVLLFALVAFTTKGGIISGLLFVLLALLISPLRAILISALPEKFRKKGVVIASGVVLALASIFSYPSTGANNAEDSAEISREIPEQEVDGIEKQEEEKNDATQVTIAETEENIKELKFSSQGEITVEEGNTTSSGYIKANVKDKELFSEDNVKFISVNPEIATVSYDKTALTTYLYFKVEGIAPGETEIYATNADGTIESEHRKVVVKVNEKLAKEKEAAEKAAEEKAAKEAEEKAAKEAEEKAAKEAEEQAAKEAETSVSTKQTSSSEAVEGQEPSTETASSGDGAGNGDAFNTYDIPEQQNTEESYVLNTHTMKFHYPSCSSVKKIKPENYATSSASRDELISQGYDPCGNCHP